MSVSAMRTRALLGWQPTGPDLLTDLDQPAYYAGRSPAHFSSTALKGNRHV
jgi:hypothetical protein